MHHDNHSRARCVYLTAEYRRLHGELVRSSQHLHPQLLEAVPADELTRLLRSLERAATAAKRTRLSGDRVVTGTAGLVPVGR